MVSGRRWALLVAILLVCLGLGTVGEAARFKSLPEAQMLANLSRTAAVATASPLTRQGHAPDVDGDGVRTIGPAPPPASAPPAPLNNGQTCASDQGARVTWTWYDQSSGVVYWTFYNPTNETARLVLNRGILQEPGSTYCFGDAFWPAYLVSNLAYISPGPYPPLGENTQDLPLGIIGNQTRLVCFVFTLAPGATYLLPEAGFNGVAPKCSALLDVKFEGNVPMSIPYSKSLQCSAFGGTTNCPPNPLQTTMPLYQPVSGSAAGAFVPSDKGGGGIVCFAEEARVALPGGRWKRMRDVAVGDLVATRRRHPQRGMETVFTRVYGFADRLPQEEGVAYVRLVTGSDGSALELTPNHLVWAARSRARGEDGGGGAFMMAGEVPLGTYLQNGDGKRVQIVRVERVHRRGAYAPLTEAGTLLVDDHWVSCYGNIRSHDVAHAVFAPLRTLYRVRQWLPVKWRMSAQLEGLHWYATLLLRIRLVVNRLVLTRFEEVS
ncbi:hypothetical protein CDCA_CDCA04G1190 [Cyanidium caldarium]|uniref:Hint domain-containing protein n=1 Tax=Cyanidium caldarium TaxID=2771 RepID=A0AAV9ISV0_CYACA|nr:hypothetical protein CDCA_CDCA04G1190 [Cyanidium caldarium]